MSGNKCSVLVSERTFEPQERAVPVAGRGQVVVRIRRVGICGSDGELRVLRGVLARQERRVPHTLFLLSLTLCALVHYWAHGKCGAFKVYSGHFEGLVCIGQERGN